MNAAFALPTLDIRVRNWIGAVILLSILTLTVNGAEVDLPPLLRAGNCRFVAGRPCHPHNDPCRRAELVSGQSPVAAVVACSDSRVPPELAFDMGLGDLFVIRTAGHVVDAVAMASAVYAVKELNVPLILVLGHESCGAVKAAVKGVDDPELAPLVKALEPAVAAARGQSGDLVENTMLENVRLVCRQLAQSPAIGGKLAEGACGIIGGRYDLESGLVTIIQ